MIYKFRGGHSAPVSAQVVGEALAALEEADALNPAAVVDVARPEEAPLHPAFEWEDPLAAELYRQDQARQLIRSVSVIQDEEEEDEAREPQIAFVSMGASVPGGARYVTSARAFSDADMRAKVLEDALRALQGLQARYGHLEELAEVFAAVAAVEAEGVGA